MCIFTGAKIRLQNTLLWYLGRLSLWSFPSKHTRQYLTDITLSLYCSMISFINTHTFSWTNLGDDSTLLWHARCNLIFCLPLSQISDLYQLYTFLTFERQTYFIKCLFHKYQTCINSTLLWHLRCNLSLLCLPLSQISDLDQQHTFLTLKMQS